MDNMILYSMQLDFNLRRFNETNGGFSFSSEIFSSQISSAVAESPLPTTTQAEYVPHIAALPAIDPLNPVARLNFDMPFTHDSENAPENVD